MVAVFMVLVGISIILALFAYLFFLANKQIKQLKSQLSASETELSALQESERHSREEATALQTQLSQTFEDPVTNLLGWQVFEDRLKQNLKESERYQFTLGILFIDIDEFKVINDALGSEIGDALLKEVGKRLETCIRQVDSITRFSKDTFVALLAQLGKPETAALVAQRMLQALSLPFLIEGNELFVTVCIGISIYPTDGQNVAGLLRSADHALHLAKSKGKGIYQFYQEKMHENSQRELVMHTSLNRESVFQEFQVFYQPIINVQDESIFCMDALLYWQHPLLGTINPQDFFNFAEKQRKLNVITEWLIKSACKQFLDWRALGFAPVCVSVPLSIKQLSSSNFIYRISQILQDLSFMPEWLLLEIKESSAPIPYDTLEKAINMLKYVGVKIGIDDFGSDSLPLTYFKDLTINYIKLHHSLIADINKNPRTVELVKAIMTLAKNLSIQVIVQGIESEQQVALLKDLGCTLMQGRLLGAPLSEREVTHKMVT